jgi:hypothetical protein
MKELEALLEACNHRLAGEFDEETEEASDRAYSVMQSAKHKVNAILAVRERSQRRRQARHAEKHTKE